MCDVTAPCSVGRHLRQDADTVHVDDDPKDADGTGISSSRDASDPATAL